MIFDIDATLFKKKKKKNELSLNELIASHQLKLVILTGIINLRIWSFAGYIIYASDNQPAR